MRCNNCPLFQSYNTEYGYEEVCAIFGDDWGNRFQYEDKQSTEIVGCYIEKAYIKKVEKEIAEHYELAAKLWKEEAEAKLKELGDK